MNKTPATAADFTRWTEKAAEMTDAALIWSIRDCAEAGRAMRGHDPIAENRYRDEMLTYQSEQAARRRARSA